MKALVKAKAEPGLWMEERPVPEIGPDDVLIKVRKTGICGTDVHIWNWDDWAQRTVPVPLVDSVQLVSDNGGGLTLAIRDYLDRVGSPNRLYTPESEVGREIVALYDGEPTYPLMRAYMTDHIVAPGSVREVATMITTTRASSQR